MALLFRGVTQEAGVTHRATQTSVHLSLVDGSR